MLFYVDKSDWHSVIRLYIVGNQWISQWESTKTSHIWNKNKSKSLFDLRVRECDE